MSESEPKADAAPTDGDQSLDGTRTDYRRIVDCVPGCVLVADAEGQIVYANKVAVATLGRPLEALLGTGWLKSLDYSLINAAQKTWKQCVQEGKSINVIWRFRQHDGIYRWHLVRAEPMRNDNGQIVQWFAVYIDIDDQKRAEERLRELRTNVSDTSRTSMGEEISASIAHEINQPLTSVLVNAQACTRWLKVNPPQVEEAIRSVERIVRDARAVDAVMRNVRLLFKRQPAVKARCNMVDLIKDAVSLIREDVNRRHTTIEYDVGEPVLMVLADRFQIQQIIINLVGNAMEAMQGSDRLPSLRIRILRTADGQVLTEFIDNGIGLPVYNIDNIFDAFVTTKKNGMGIGLSISRSIVEAHGGKLWAENNPDWGAKFSLLLGTPEPTAGSE